jgi:hypothetical protein
MMRKETFVYFLRMNEFVKIGYTNNWVNRLDTIQTGIPYTVIPLLVLRGNFSLEAELHRLFHADRYRGEWFRLSPAIEAFIRENIDKSVVGETALPKRKPIEAIDSLKPRDAKGRFVPTMVQS